MSLLFCDSFGHYTTGEEIKKWGEADRSTTFQQADISVDWARFGIDQGFSMRNALNWIAIFIPQRTRLIVGFGFNITNHIDPTTGDPIHLLSFWSPFQSWQASLTLEENFSLAVNRGSGTIVGQTTGGVIVPNKYHFIEIDIEIANVANVEIRVDDETVLTLSGVDTQASSATDGVGRIVLGRENSISDSLGGDAINLPGGRTSLADVMRVMFDDFYICDDNGSVNNSFLGDVRIEPLWPDGAGDYAEWTPNAGANWQAVDEATPDGTTTEVHTNTKKALDLHTFDNSGGSDGVVRAIALNLWGQQTTHGGLSSVVAAIKTGGAVYYGDVAFPMQVGEWNGYQYIFETNPDTAAAWTISELDGLQAGYKRQS